MHRRLETLIVLLLALAARSAVGAEPRATGAEPGARPDFQFALLKYAGGNWNPRPHGLTRLAWEVRKRTSIAVDLEVAAADPESDSLFDYPILVWQGDAAFAPLSAAAILNLRQHLMMGGTLLVDVADGVVGGPFHSAVSRELQRILPDMAQGRLPFEHVLYKSFFLIDRHGGRVPSQPFLEGISVEGRLAVLVSTNDLAGAMSKDDFGQWEYDVGLGGDATREMTFRLGVNIVMYALCLDYKDDQVHVSYILRRRR